MRPALSLLIAPATMRLPEVCTVSTGNNGVVLSAPVPVPVPALVPEPVRVSGVSSESLDVCSARGDGWASVAGAVAGSLRTGASNARGMPR